MKKEIIINAQGGILGRIAAFSAKQALFGKKVIIVNCNEILITGEKNKVKEKYLVLRKKGGTSIKGPRISKMPEKIMKRTIRGMLSHKQGRGSDAFNRIRCYNTCPAECEHAEKIEMKRPAKTKLTKLLDVSREL